MLFSNWNRRGRAIFSIGVPQLLLCTASISLDGYAAAVGTILTLEEGGRITCRIL